MDKLRMSFRHAVQADGSFALRGIVSVPSGYWRMDSPRQLPSGGEQVLKNSQPTVSLSGVRTIHGSRMVSEPTRGLCIKPTIISSSTCEEAPAACNLFYLSPDIRNGLDIPYNGDSHRI